MSNPSNKTLMIVLASCGVLAVVAGAIVLCLVLGVFAWLVPTRTVVSTPVEVVITVSAPTAVVEPSAVPTRVQSTPTPVPTTAQPAASETPAANISAGGVKFYLYRSIAAAAKPETVQATPHATDGPWWDANPQYQMFSLEGYVLAETFHDPVIAIYPVEEYTNMDENAGKIITNLKILLAKKPASVDQLPFLPMWNAGQVMHARLEYLNFQNGSGVRYLTEYAQYTAPINNYDLFYTFQGLTSDGKYYVSAILPVSHPGLPAKPDLSQDAMEKITKDYTQYLAGMISMLEAQPAGSFVPGIDPDLDALIQSLNVQ